MKRIVTLTVNPSIDVSAEVERVEPDRKLRCDSPRYEPGGGGINVSRAIRNLGGESLAIFPAGGPVGDHLVRLLDRDGIIHRSVPIEEMTRQNMNFLEASGGRQYRFVMPGPRLSEEEWTRCLEEVSAVTPEPDYIVASGSLTPGAPPRFYTIAAEIARKSNARMVVDTSGEALRAATEPGVYLLKVNMREFGQLIGREIRDEADQEEEARRVVERGMAEVLVISLGSAGALLADSGGVERLRAPIVPIRSKVGAGDSMVAGIVLALSRDQTVGDAVRFGIAAGAAAVMTPGTELCRREDTERIYDRLIAESSVFSV